MGSGGRARDERGKCHRASVPFRLCLFTKHMLMKCVAGPGRERERWMLSLTYSATRRGEKVAFFFHTAALLKFVVDGAIWKYFSTASSDTIEKKEEKKNVLIVEPKVEGGLIQC